MHKPRWVKKLWNGDFSLLVSFWLFGILFSPISFALGITLNILLSSILGFIWGILFITFNLSRSPDLIAIALITLLMTLIYQAIWLVGTWRASAKYTGNEMWKYSARVWLAFELIILFISLRTLVQVLMMF